MESDLKLNFYTAKRNLCRKEIEYVPALTLKHCRECYTFSLSFLRKGKAVVVIHGPPVNGVEWANAEGNSFNFLV